MKKILVSLLMSGFCSLMAAAFDVKGDIPDTSNDEAIASALHDQLNIGVDAITSATAVDSKYLDEPVQAFSVTASISDFSILDAKTYTRIPVTTGGDMILIEGKLYPVQRHIVWDHQEGISYRTTFEHIDDLAKNLFLGVENRLPLLHVGEKPNEIADRSNVLWKVARNREQARQHHIPTGKEITQWQIKDGFQMFIYRYMQTDEDLYGLVSGREVVLTSRVVSRNLVRGAQVSGKKGKTTWCSNPSGQGSNGLVPSAAEFDTVFDAMFGR